MKTYITNDENGYTKTFSKLSDLRMFLGLDKKDANKCFHPGVHVTENGIPVITYQGKELE